MDNIPWWVWMLALFVFALLLYSCFFLKPLKSKPVPVIPENPQIHDFYTNQWKSDFLHNLAPNCLTYLPTFHGEYWNTPYASKFNNCYAYAFRNLDLNRNHKPQPGELSAQPQIAKDCFTCESVFHNVVSDHPGTVKWNSSSPCPCGSYKGYLVLSSNPSDYHFLREDSNGFWSQKLGSGAATQYDAGGSRIVNPATANLNYGDYNYKTRCFAFCTPYNSTETAG